MPPPIAYRSTPPLPSAIPAPTAALILQLTAILALVFGGLLSLSFIAAGALTIPRSARNLVFTLAALFFLAQFLLGILYLLRAPAIRRGNRRAVWHTLFLLAFHIGINTLVTGILLWPRVRSHSLFLSADNDTIFPTCLLLITLPLIALAWTLARCLRRPRIT
ncbi:MAG TPA: hypothetical protein VHQ47_03900 [Phycisphaerae bacterium]|jgi:hypothetical protein|nr:hypothetical protein [Phycisphaerae bacterium]